MGFILSKFRRQKPSTKDALDGIEKELRDIRRFQFDTELAHKKIVGRFFIFSCLIYFLFAAGFYFFGPVAENFTDRLIYATPLIIFPFLIWFIKRLINWHFDRKIHTNKEKYETLKKEKQNLLDEVMEKETFKVAKEILEKYAPGQLLPKHLAEAQQRQNLSPQQSQLSLVQTPRSAFNDGLRRRNVSFPLNNRGMMSTPQRFPGPGPYQPTPFSVQGPRPMLRIQGGNPLMPSMPSNSNNNSSNLSNISSNSNSNTNSKNTDLDSNVSLFNNLQASKLNAISEEECSSSNNALPYNSHNSVEASGPSSSPMMRQQRPVMMPMLPPANPVFQKRSMNWFDKVVEFAVGDGPSYRYALICKYCATHNGLSIPEDFPYTGFRCVFCHQYNPPKSVRPSAEKLSANENNGVEIEEMKDENNSSPIVTCPDSSAGEEEIEMDKVSKQSEDEGGNEIENQNQEESEEGDENKNLEEKTQQETQEEEENQNEEKASTHSTPTKRESSE